MNELDITPAKLYESLALRGDISGLSPQEKTRYYAALCERLGLDPYTQPFTPLRLNGKEILYASRAATDQLARIHNVNRSVTSRERIEDVYIVTVRASLPNGRNEDAVGAVAIGGLKGEALANALMKAETKAKRRATLAILGLGMLDESEIDSIPKASVAPAQAIEPVPDERIVQQATEVVEELMQESRKQAEAMRDIRAAWPQPATGGQLRAMRAILNDMGLSDEADRDLRLAWCGWIIDREIESSKGLTEPEAQLLNRALRMLLEDQGPSFDYRDFAMSCLSAITSHYSQVQGWAQPLGEYAEMLVLQQQAGGSDNAE